MIAKINKPIKQRRPTSSDSLGHFIDPKTLDLSSFQERPAIRQDFVKGKDGNLVKVNYLIQEEDSPESISSFNSKISYTTGIDKKTKKNKNPMAALDEIEESEEDSRMEMKFEMEGDQFVKIKQQAHYDTVYDKWMSYTERIRTKTRRNISQHSLMELQANYKVPKVAASQE